MPKTKWLAYAGQSNALQASLPAPPSGCAFSRVGISSAPIGAGHGPWPNGWGSSDPNGWRHRLASEALVHRATLASPPAILWFHGESDALGQNEDYATEMIAFIANMDSRVGRSDIVWPIIQLNIAFADYVGIPGADTGTPIIRAQYAPILAAYPTRVRIVDVDDIVPGEDGTAHYLTAQHATIFGRVKEAIADMTSDASWDP